MKITLITIEKSAKLSKNYNTVSVTLSITSTLEDGDSIELTNSQLNKRIDSLILNDITSSVHLLKR